MDIKYLGHSSFLLKGKKAVLVTDPYSSSAVGLKFPRNIEADIVSISHEHDDHNDTKELAGDPFVIRGPGEYEVKGVTVIGISSFHDDEKGNSRGKNTIYKIMIDGLNILHLGDLGHVLNANIIDELDGIDILMVPIGGVYTIDSKTALQIISDINPSIIIPMHFARPELKKDVFGKLEKLSNFIKESGKTVVKIQGRLNITRDKLPEEIQIMVFE
ncbi:MBL fold metallo-hydrolase [Patescibacteria group bacterium]